MLPYFGYVNNAAVNIRVDISFQISVFIFFRQIPRSGIAGEYGSSVFNFLRTLFTVFKVAETNYTPTEVYECFLYFTLLPTFVICRCFEDSHSDRWEVISPSAFDLHIPDD